jgi:hypothetical protein
MPISYHNTVFKCLFHTLILSFAVRLFQLSGLLSLCSSLLAIATWSKLSRPLSRPCCPRAGAAPRYVELRQFDSAVV